mgnify:CR=1 FL=1
MNKTYKEKLKNTVKELIDLLDDKEFSETKKNFICGELAMLTELIREHLQSPIKDHKGKELNIGDEVLCDWGSGGAGFVKEGVVVCNTVKYNNSLKFAPEGSEDACIIRFKPNQTTWNGKPLGINIVVPNRQIEKRV